MQVWAKRVTRILACLLMVVAVIAAVAITFTVGWRPVIGAKARRLTNRRFEPTPERLQRGDYLVHGVLGCVFCHSAQDEKHPGAPVMVGSAGAGRVFVEHGTMRVVAPNITPDPETGIGAWSDDAIARAVREGISADGRVLFPIMPYQEFRHLSDEDLASVVVYLRTLPPAHNVLPKTEVPFALQRLIQGLPEPVTAPVPTPDVSTPARRGEYLAEVGGCVGCHTPSSPPPLVQPIAALRMAGGSQI